MNKLFRSIAKRVPWRTRTYALNQLDLKLRQYLDCQNGFFIEAGANDGRRQSNSLLLEEQQGWTGLLVEPIPQLAELCRKNRPNCIVENYALVADDYDQDMVEMTYCGLMSTVRGGMRSQEDEELHIRQGSEVQKIEPFQVQTPAITLTALLRKHAIEQVDLLSLDVEGYELSVLKGLDLDQVAPRFMLIECRYRDEIDAYLGDRYQVEAELSHHDVLYRRII